LFIAVISILLLSTAAVAWDQLEENFIVKRWGMVEPGLYRSSEMSQSMCEYTLSKCKIHTILSLGLDTPGDPDKLPEQQASAKLHIDRTDFDMRGDGTAPLESYVQAVTMLTQAQRAGKITMVHCGSGVNRTGGVLACYKMLVQGESAQSALAHMKAYDFSSDRNEKLLPFLNDIMPELAQRLKDDGIIDHVPNPIPQLVE
jgi:predicted protein tyrosine phosphatase